MKSSLKFYSIVFMVFFSLFCTNILSYGKTIQESDCKLPSPIDKVSWKFLHSSLPAFNMCEFRDFSVARCQAFIEKVDHRDESSDEFYLIIRLGLEKDYLKKQLPLDQVKQMVASPTFKDAFIRCITVQK